ncbi:MAG: hypothetical protein HKO09_03435 [Croceitalea sp.]|nr:hypothetical protein [Croceitalea sp.]
MRRWISFIGHLTIILVLTSFGTITFNNKPVEVPNALKSEPNQDFDVAQAEISANESYNSPTIYLKKSFIGFREALAFKESQGDYSAVNTLGYMGKYQFGKGTLRMMGVHDTFEFINNPKLQEQVFKLNVARNKWILRRDIKRFVGKRINGTVISESGIVAAAHLAGAGNVKKYLRSYGQEDFEDAYGSNVAYYIKKFAHYDISSIKAENNPQV